MADRQVRPVEGSLSETLLHLTCGTTVVVAFYLFATVVGEAVVMAVRYASG